MNKITISNNEQDTELIAIKLAPIVSNRVVFLQGGLGAGKTTLVKYIAKHLGFDPVVYSPTFSIANRYEIDNNQLIHFDLYRIESDEELEMTGFYELIEDDATIFIEWADKFNEINTVVKDPVIIKITKLDNTKRKFEVLI